MRRDLAALADRELDVVVVGGGICGAAIAWDAAQRGLSTALVERGDFGAATSANSLKVVHGGIRYLQHFDLRRLRESSSERRTMFRIAPHLAHPLPVVVPTFGRGRRGAGILAAGFSLFNALTWDRNSGLSDPARRIPPARLISRRELLDWDPSLEHPQLTGGGLFWDGQLSNPSRLVWEFVRTAGRAGVLAANQCEVTGFLRRGARIGGVAVLDRLGGGRFEVRARVVVNAAGPFADQLYTDTGLRSGGGVPLSRDLALVIRQRLVHERALAIQTRYRDPSAVLSRGPRHLFVVPWRDVTLIGVNSIVYRGDPYALTVTQQEIQEFLDEINQAAPGLRLTLYDVALVLAGLLPISGDNLADGNISFGKRPLIVDNARSEGLEGLVTAITNRYTIARLVAERTVDLVFRKLGKSAPACRTAETPLYGGSFPGAAQLVHEVLGTTSGQLRPQTAERLAWNHGSAYGEVLEVMSEKPEYRGTVGGSFTLKAEVVHAVRAEMALRLADCVFRRTELGTAGDPGSDALESCAQLMAGELGWSAGRTASELAHVRTQFPSGATDWRIAPCGDPISCGTDAVTR